MRLDQLIAAHTPYSRKEVKLLLRQKQIKVNDLIIAKADTKVQPEQDTITIKGEPLVLRPSSRYLLLNKPAGYVCATEDARDPTVLELVPDALQCKGLFPAGRLDKDSKGLVQTVPWRTACSPPSDMFPNTIWCDWHVLFLLHIAMRFKPASPCETAASACRQKRHPCRNWGTPGRWSACRRESTTKSNGCLLLWETM